MRRNITPIFSAYFIGTVRNRHAYSLLKPCSDCENRDTKYVIACRNYVLSELHIDATQRDACKNIRVGHVFDWSFVTSLI